MLRRSIGTPGLSSSGSRDPAGYRRPRGTWRRLVAVGGTVAMVAGMLALGTPAANAAAQRGASQSAGSVASTAQSGAYVVTLRAAGS